MTEAAGFSFTGQTWLAAGILATTYGVIISERINRAIVALLGAGFMIVTGILTQEQAIEGVDFNTLALLVGMMVLVGVSRRSGMFQYLAIWSAKIAHGRSALILLLLSVVTAILSALLDNVTTVLLIAPVTLVIAEELELPAYPFLFTEILASNIGGTATLIGDPPNIIIGSAAKLTFNDFVINLGPVVVIILLAQIGINHMIWGRKLKTSDAARQRVMGFRPVDSITDRRLLWQSLTVLALVIGGFVMAHSLGLEAGTIALLGAALLLLLDNLGRKAEDQTHHVHDSFAQVEWVTIFFFVGLFIVVAGVEHVGLLAVFADWLVNVTGGDAQITTIAILWSSAILSAIIDNIPFVATMIPVIQNMGASFGAESALLPLWWALSLGACLGGNGSLIGASANLTVAGIAEKAGVRFRFIPFMLLAFPMMLFSVAIATIYVYIRYLG